jgi:hypothetical protein
MRSASQYIAPAIYNIIRSDVGSRVVHLNFTYKLLQCETFTFSHIKFFSTFSSSRIISNLWFTLSPRCVYGFSPTQNSMILIYTYILAVAHSPSSTSTNLSILFNNETFLLREMMLLLLPSPKNAH